MRRDCYYLEQKYTGILHSFCSRSETLHLVPVSYTSEFLAGTRPNEVNINIHNMDFLWLGLALLPSVHYCQVLPGEMHAQKRWVNFKENNHPATPKKMVSDHVINSYIFLGPATVLELHMALILQNLSLDHNEEMSPCGSLLVDHCSQKKSKNCCTFF